MVVRHIAQRFSPWLRPLLVLIGCLGSVGAGYAATGTATLSNSAARAFDGTWVGTFEQDSSGLGFLALRIDASQKRLRINVSLRSERIAGARATGVVLDGDRLTFDVHPEDNPNRAAADWHFVLQGVGRQITGEIERPSTDGAGQGPSHFSLHMQRALDLKLEQFRPFVGNYRLAERTEPARAGDDADGDVFFVGYGSNPTNRGNSNYAYLTRGDRMQQIVPIAPGTFLTDDGARVVFERDASGLVNRLRWTDAKQAAALTPVLLGPVVRLDGAAPPAGQLADRVELWRQEEVSFSGSGAVLSGTLYLPSSPGPHPALVFVHGSGPQTRLDNWSMADRFARAGIACLSFDKRGTGKSTGDWEQADFDVLADDVLAAVERLRARPEIQGDQIGLWGVSQAGWVIPLAANKSDHVAFCIPVSGGAVSPAEQELWRRTQYLRFFGCDSRLLEGMRRAVAMHFQWEQLYKAGKFPIPPLFDVEPLNMDLDAPALIRGVRQPVLAIFGDSDVLTPPRESAAIWANELAAGGNSDYAVRLFPHATHGLLVSDRPFEVLPESRLAPGYLKTMVDWIAAHTRGAASAHNPISTAGAAAGDGPASRANSDMIEITAGTPDVVESRGLGKLPWYGSAPVQVTLMLAAALGSFWTLALWPAAWGIRKFRRMPRRGPPDRPTIVMGWIVNLSALAMFLSVLGFLRFLGDASPSGYYKLSELGLVLLALLALPVAAASVLLLKSSIESTGARGRSLWEAVSVWITGGSVGLWFFLFVYWTWGPLLS